MKLVKVLKDGKEILPGTYMMPEASGDHFRNPSPLDEWLKDMSFVLENDTSKNVVSVGIAVVLPARQTGLECLHITGGNNAWCDAHPHWCDGGCPALLHKTLHWGRMPAMTASGLRARNRATGRVDPPGFPDGKPLQGTGWLRFAPGEEIELSVAGRSDGFLTVTDPRHGFSDSMNLILYEEGLEEAQDTEPCDNRRASKQGCAFREVSKFNIGLDVVYFEDGTIWGNYGYGYALPNPDGIFTRAEPRDFLGGLKPTPAVN
ncbi:MAG TPA: hypothetical protein VG028_09995 [Terriglobia bacterium]|nr:hypothetical protein [Terriglobia bacterium]